MAVAERKRDAKGRFASENEFPHIQPSNDDRGRVIGVLPNGWTVHALETYEQYKAEGSSNNGPGGCMSSMDWMTPTKKKAYRGLSCQDADGKRRCTIVLEWEDYNTNPQKRHVGAGYTNYTNHGVVNGFAPFGDGEMYRFNHFGFSHLPQGTTQSDMKKILGQWFVECGGVLENDEEPEDVVTNNHHLAVKRAKKRDMERFEKAHPGVDYKERLMHGWTSDVWTKITDAISMYFTPDGFLQRYYWKSAKDYLAMLENNSQRYVYRQDEKYIAQQRILANWPEEEVTVGGAYDF